MANSRLLRRYTIWLAPLLLAVFLLIFLTPDLSSNKVTVSSGYVQSESPGIYLPAVYFLVNYTGIGSGNFGYTVTYNTTDGQLHTQQANIIVSPASHFTYYLFLSWPKTGLLLVHIRVCEGKLSVACAPLFEKTLLIRAPAS